MGISQNMITDIKQVKSGQIYIEAMCLWGELSLSTQKVVGVPYQPGPHLPNSWFGKTRVNAQWSEGTFDSQFSFCDCNVIPNSYNDHSMWRFTTKVRNYLQGLTEAGPEGVQEYLEHLAHHKRGATFHGNRRGSGLNVERDDFDEVMWA